MDVQQGAAAVAGIDGRIGLDEIVVYRIIGSDAPVQRADNTGGDRMRKPERVTDGDDGFADHEIFGISHFNRRQIFLVSDFQYSQVRIRVYTHDLGLKLPFILQRNRD